MAYPRVVVATDAEDPSRTGREGALLYVYEANNSQWGMVLLDGDVVPLVYGTGALEVAKPQRVPAKRTAYAWAKVTHAEAGALARNMGLTGIAWDRFTTQVGDRLFSVGLEVDQDTGETSVVSVDGLMVERRKK